MTRKNYDHIELHEYAELRREYADFQGRFNELLGQYSMLLARMEKILDERPSSRLSPKSNVKVIDIQQKFSVPKFTFVDF